jgi:uncharacterized membrane protein YqjE
MISAQRPRLRERSTGDLIRDLSRQASVLARMEVQLAKTEMAEKAQRAGVGVAALVAAGVAALAALGALTAFLIVALDGAMPAWAAALLVALLWALVAGGLGWYGREKLRETGSPVPEKTVETLKEDFEWLRHPTN